MFSRPHHQKIARLLAAFNADFLERANWYFGGGTAIVLLLGEYRESIDIDFLCSSKEGYRSLRNTVTQNGLGDVLREPVSYLREVRAERDKVYTILEMDGQPVKTEFVLEGRISLDGARHPELGLPVLCREDMYAEKLLANADRWADRTAMSRDIIDLAMMISAWGPIPPQAWRKTRDAYGAAVDKAFGDAIRMVDDQAWLASCLHRMQMDPGALQTIRAVLRSANDGSI
jgi:hypothetical protein